MSETYEITIDKDIYEYLQKYAKPFVDTPNSVLRKLLHIDDISTISTIADSAALDSDSSMITRRIKKASNQDTIGFVKDILHGDFNERFKRRAPYRFMFESDNYLIYFQNFNKENDKLWYRITSDPYKLLKDSKKESLLYLTNPAEKIAYVIPVKDILARANEMRWVKEYLEINIDNMAKKWIELDWGIQKYLKRY